MELCARVRRAVHVEGRSQREVARVSRCTQIADFRASLYSNRGQRAEGRTRPPSPTDVSFAFKSRPHFIVNFVRDLTTKLHDFSAMTLQLKRGQY